MVLKTDTMFIANTATEKEEVIEEFLMSLRGSTLLIIGKYKSDVTLSVASLFIRKLYDYRVIIHQGYTSIIGSSAHVPIKVIYCRTTLDDFAKAIIAEYNPAVAFFD